MGEKNILNELKQEEELSWVQNSVTGEFYETAWRDPVPGIKDSEDVLDIRYEIDADYPTMTETQYKKNKSSEAKMHQVLRTLKSVSEKTTVDEFYCRTYDEQIKFSCKDTNTRYCISPTGGWCQAPGGREAVYLHFIACATKSSACPPITDCVFSDQSIYFDESLRKIITTKNWSGSSDIKPDYLNHNNNEDTHNRKGGAGQ